MVGVIVQVSLRTKEPNQARIWHSVADGALKLIWQACRDGSKGCAESDQPLKGAGHADPIPVANLDAEKPRSRAATASSESKTPPITVCDLFERWAAYSADKKALNTIKRYRNSFRSLGAFAKKRDVRTLTADDLYGWAEHRRDVEGVSPRAINKNDTQADGRRSTLAPDRDAGRPDPVALRGAARHLPA
ncbi:integrase family protein [Methylorubrum populi]|uniref:Integrase family protein n=1 Tax=Methylorubrum populi TaxID=223967 RepID=A0A160PIB8_9HYPH|nr:integrase family protein [Methylorubrum populi]